MYPSFDSFTIPPHGQNDALKVDRYMYAAPVVCMVLSQIIVSQKQFLQLIFKCLIRFINTQCRTVRPWLTQVSLPTVLIAKRATEFGITNTLRYLQQKFADCSLKESTKYKSELFSQVKSGQDLTIKNFMKSKKVKTFCTCWVKRWTNSYFGSMWRVGESEDQHHMIQIMPNSCCTQACNLPNYRSLFVFVYTKTPHRRVNENLSSSITS